MFNFTPTPQRGALSGDEYQPLKGHIHKFLVESIEEEQASVDEWPRPLLRRYVDQKVHDYIQRARLPVNQREMEALVGELIDELVGYGPIQPLIADDTISDILVNGAKRVYVEKRGRLEETGVRFMDDRHVQRIIQRIIAPLGRRLDESNPMVDARLPDGSRVNAIIAPLALDGPCLSIRKFRKEPLTGGDLLAYQTLSDEMLEFMRTAVRNRASVLISGGTGAGKTTLLNVLSQSIPPEERLVTIEDAAELSLGHPHVVRLETRPANLEGQGEVTARDLVRNALRMRPDRIILGEVRGVEVMDMLQAMNTGHAGSMTTIHANTPRDALSRLELLAGFAGFSGREDTLRSWVASAIDIVIQIARMPGGERKVISIDEVTGYADDKITLHEIFHYDRAERRFSRSNTFAVGSRSGEGLERPAGGALRGGYHGR
ncbi:CpaF family protein [Thioalbus denitrificans]|uniref:Pilus assembly protein CpaF n=1 Tax=Thioalbus denitrificans TaxID=547122 RepID=A0A369C700_9GAMM|nr:CpaF family protein [Thioalbus denitrificans]RCX29780.1 pilus assembly protein CpaF [Thioalbus denitrificans]